ncbi:MAG: DUF5018 domain-containing protein [Rikenellaceae bacterium]|nr:DUF5018 domain-containing protein [Rikenellaceae bacterium]
MKKLLSFMAAAVALFAVSCVDEYDDSAVWDKIREMDSRLEYLEDVCKEMNTNISALQTIVEALQKNDYVTGIVPIQKGGEVIGYTISFAKSDSITIYTNNGGEGVGYTPQIGVKQDTDGKYYWTIDGEWLLDENGNKVKAVGEDGKDGQNGQDGKPGADGKPGQDGEDGKDGQPGAPGQDGEDGKDGQDGQDGEDGVTPELKIENGMWYVSYDDGATWTELGKATGEDGQNGQDGKPGEDGEDGVGAIVDVTWDENNVYFTLYDGTVITLPLGDGAGVEEPEVEIEKITVADFLAAADTAKTYELTGEITRVANTTYGNFDLTDETGTIYVYGLLTPEGEAKTQWAAAGLKLGDKITIQGVYSTYNESPQIQNAIYVSHEEGEPEPGPEVTAGIYTSDEAFVCTVDNSDAAAYGLGATVIGEESVTGFKLGTSKMSGVFTSAAVGVEGDKTLSFYAVAWKGASATLYVRVNGVDAGSFELAANNGATSTAPYTALTFAETDKYSVELTGLTAASVIEFSTSANFAKETSSAPRAIVCGVKLTDAEAGGDEPAAKLPYGYRAGSEEVVWSKALSELSLTAANANHIAATGKYLIVAAAGEAPVVLDALTGEYVQTLDLGEMAGANAAITADSEGNIVVSSFAEATGFRIGRMKDINDTLEVFITRDSQEYGKDLSVVGDVYGDARLTLMYSPWSSGTTGHLLYAISGGVADDGYWSKIAAGEITDKIDNNNGDVIYRDMGEGAPYFMSGYSSNCFVWAEAGTAQAVQVTTNSNCGAVCLDVTEFNGAKYLMTACDTYFTWSLADAGIYFADVTTIENFKAGVVYFSTGALEWNAASMGGGTDCALSVSEDGVYMYAYVLHPGGKVGCIRVDCLDK